MIRNAMFGLSLLALSAGSALAAPAKHVSKPRTVAEATAPAGDSASPRGEGGQEDEEDQEGQSPQGRGRPRAPRR